MAHVAVIIPLYNRIDPALRAVRSVLVQTYRDYELILVDDGSTIDITPVTDAVAQGGGRMLRVEHRGPAAARNAGAAAVCAPWLAFLDSDDEWLPQKLAKQVEFAEERACRICQTEEIWIRRGEFVNPKNCHAKPEGEAFYRSLELCCISPSAVMLQAELFAQHGGFDEEMLVCEDYDLWLRIAAREEVPLLKEPLLKKYGGHEDQLSRAEPAMDRFRIYALVKLLVKGELSEPQESSARDAAVSKCEVLLQGAAKRGRAETQRFYETVKEQILLCDRGALKKLLPALVNELHERARYET